jgi:hypothetical protein
VNVVMGVDVRGVAAGELAETLELRVEVPSGTVWVVEVSVIVGDEVKADRQRSQPGGRAGRVGGAGSEHHQTRARHDPVRVGFEDSVVDSARESEIVGVDDQQPH